MSKDAIGSLGDIYDALGKDLADSCVARAIGYRATTGKHDTLEAVRAGRAVELEECMDYRDREAVAELVTEILEARESNPRHPSEGIRAWMAESAEQARFGRYTSDWMLSRNDVTASDVAALVNCILGDDGLWTGGYIEREDIADDLIEEVENLGLDCTDLDPADLAEELRDRFGLESVFVTGDDVARTRFPQTILIGDKGCTRQADQVSRSRHAFDAALEYLWALDDAGPGDPAPTFGGGNYRAGAEDIANSNLQWLCETQGTSLMDVLTPGSAAHGTPFAKALRQEILEAAACEAAWPYLAVLVETTVGEHLELTTASHSSPDPRAGVLVESAMVGIHDPVNGAGGVLDLGNWGGAMHMGPFVVPDTMVALAMPDGLDFRNDTYDCRYTVETVHGLVGECWSDSRTEQLPADDPRLDAAYALAAPAREPREAQHVPAPFDARPLPETVRENGDGDHEEERL